MANSAPKAIAPRKPGFQPGNKAAVGAKHDATPRFITQQLTSLLNECVRKRKDDKDFVAEETNVRRICRRLVENAIDGDTTAAKEIFDRVEGRAKQGVEISGSLGIPAPTTLPADLRTKSKAELVQLYRERVNLPVSAAIAATAPGSTANN